MQLQPTPAPFAVNHPDYTVRCLTISDADKLQGLFVTCDDFFELTNGAPPAPSAARDEFIGRQFWQRMGFEVIRKTAPRPYGLKTHEVYVYRRTLPIQFD